MDESLQKVIFHKEIGTANQNNDGTWSSKDSSEAAYTMGPSHFYSKEQSAKKPKLKAARELVKIVQDFDNQCTTEPEIEIKVATAYKRLEQRAQMEGSAPPLAEKAQSHQSLRRAAQLK